MKRLSFLFACCDKEQAQDELTPSSSTASIAAITIVSDLPGSPRHARMIVPPVVIPRNPSIASVTENSQHEDEGDDDFFLDREPPSPVGRFADRHNKTICSHLFSDDNPSNEHKESEEEKASSILLTT